MFKNRQKKCQNFIQIPSFIFQQEDSEYNLHNFQNENPMSLMPAKDAQDRGLPVTSPHGNFATQTLSHVNFATL